MATATATKQSPNATQTSVRDRGYRSDWAKRLPLLPAFIFVFALTQIPFVITIVVSLMNWNANFPDQVRFAWFANYIQVFTQPDLRLAVLATVLLTITVVVVSLILGSVIALLLNQRFRGRGVVRTMMIAPFLIVPVAAALVWKNLLLEPTYGLINGVLTLVFSAVGLTPPQPSLVTDFPLISVEVALIWQWTPFMMLLILAGLQSQPGDVLEAARVDGAKGIQILRYITYPHMRRYVQLAALLGSIYILQNFDAVFTLTGGAFGTANIPYTIYQEFFQAQDYGLASAMGVIAVIGTIVVTTLFLRSLTTLTEETNRL